MHYDREKWEIVTDRLRTVRETIKLNPMENAIFRVLWDRQPGMVPRSDLLDAMDSVNPKTFHTHQDLGVYICWMRKKLRDGVKVKTHYNKGYSLQWPIGTH